MNYLMWEREGGVTAGVIRLNSEMINFSDASYPKIQNQPATSFEV